MNLISELNFFFFNVLYVYCLFMLYQTVTLHSKATDDISNCEHSQYLFLVCSVGLGESRLVLLY